MRTVALAFLIFLGAIIGGIIAQPAMGYIRGAIAQALNVGPAGSWCVEGIDSTNQFCVGYMAGAAEYYQMLGGLSGQGASLISTGSSTNISMNVTAKGTGSFLVGDASGPIFAGVGSATLINSDGALQATPSPSGAGAMPAKVGNSHYGVQLDCGSNLLCIPMANQTPASSSATCQTGQMTWDTSFVYVCVATNSWRRIANATF